MITQNVDVNGWTAEDEAEQVRATVAESSAALVPSRHQPMPLTEQQHWERAREMHIGQQDQMTFL